VEGGEGEEEGEEGVVEGGGGKITADQRLNYFYHARRSANIVMGFARGVDFGPLGGYKLRAPRGLFSEKDFTMVFLVTDDEELMDTIGHRGSRRVSMEDGALIVDRFQYLLRGPNYRFFNFDRTTEEFLNPTNAPRPPGFVEDLSTDPPDTWPHKTPDDAGRFVSDDQTGWTTQYVGVHGVGREGASHNFYPVYRDNVGNLWKLLNCQSYNAKYCAMVRDRCLIRDALDLGIHPSRLYLNFKYYDAEDNLLAEPVRDYSCRQFPFSWKPETVHDWAGMKEFLVQYGRLAADATHFWQGGRPCNPTEAAVWEPSGGQAGGDGDGGEEEEGEQAEEGADGGD
jgi:hypothetical protein